MRTQPKALAEEALWGREEELSLLGKRDPGTPGSAGKEAGRPEG